MYLRRSAALLAASAALCAVTAPAAVAAPASDDGLYGTGDPTYDGVWRQSLTLLAQDAARVVPSKKAVRWLTDQQCDDGSFPAYRASTDGDCGKKAAPNTNATGIAVQALVALGGHDKAVHKAVQWLQSVQNDDGGWGYTAGAPSDANSVSLVIGSLAAAGEQPAKTTGKDGATPYDALLGFRLGCDAKPDARGAFAYQPDKQGTLAPNADATAAAALGGLGEGVVVAPGAAPKAAPAAALTCGEDGKDAKDEEVDPKRAAEAGAAYLTAVLKGNDHHLQSVMPGAKDQPDWSNTADAVIALAAGGHDKAADASLSWLEKHVGDWDKAASDPAALSQLVLAAHATGHDPHDFGGVDLVERLAATGPKPQGTKPNPATGAAASEEKSDDGGDGTVWVISLVGAGLAAGIGVGLAMSARRRKDAS